MTYKENIERLRARGRYNLAQRQANANARIGFIRDQEKEAIDNINKASDLLVGKNFGEGGLVPYMYGEYIEEQNRKGIEAEKKDRARKVAELEQKLQEASDVDTAHLNVKYDMLINGYLYEDADRFAQLSPHAQTAYARRKLGLWKESVADKLNYRLAKDNTEYQLENWDKPLSSADIHNDPLVPPVVKEAFVNRVLEDLIKENGIDGFSNELLELERINDYVNPETNEIEFGAHSKAKSKVMGKYRENYNIASSNAQKIKLLENFKSDRDLLKLHAGLKGLYDPKTKGPAGNLEAWNMMVELLSDMIVHNDEFEEQDLKDLFDNLEKSPSPTIPGKSLFYSHRRWYDKIIEKAAYKKQQNERATNILLEKKGSEFKKNAILDMQEGGPLYQSIQKEIENSDFKEREKVVNRALMDLQERWRQAGGQWDTGKYTLAPWINDLYTDLVYTNQEELLGLAMTKLDKKQTILPQDWEVLDPKSRATLQNHPNWASNQALITESALQFRTVTPSGEAGYGLAIPLMVKQALKKRKLADDDPRLVNDISGRMLAFYQTKFKEALDVKKDGSMTPDGAHQYALGEVAYELGLDTKDGEMRPGDKVEKTLDYQYNHTSLLDEKDVALANRATILADILKKKADETGGKLTEQAYWIPSLGPNSQAFKQLLAYAEGQPGSEIPKIYHVIAGYMPYHNYEQLASWQLAQVGKTLPASSAAQEAMRILEKLGEFHRRIGFKANSTDIQQAKIIAVDGQKFTIGKPFVDTDKDSDAKTISDQLNLEGSGYSLVPSGDGTYRLKEESDTTTVTGTPTTFETTSLSFDERGLPVWAPIEDNPMYMGNNLEGWLEKYGPAGGEAEDAGDVTREISAEEEKLNAINDESNRLNTIYNDKGFHDEDPGPPPKLEDFPIQPGDERFVVPLDPRITAEFYNYNVYAFQEAKKEWEQKKNTYRPLTKQVTRGARKKYTSTMYFNPETDKYEYKDVESRLFPETKVSGKEKAIKGRELQRQFLKQKAIDARLERASVQPDSKVVNTHRTDDGRYIQGPITVYKHVDKNGFVKYKLKPPGSSSNLQSFWNIPGSPVLSPAVQGYAMELYNSNFQTA